MALYEVLADSYINNRIVRAGEQVEFDGIPHASNLRAVDKQAAKVAAEVGSVPPSVQTLVDQARLHAATRGADPATADLNDIAAYVEGLQFKPSQAVIDAAAKILSGAAAVA